jgi:hypothetical protein
MGIPTTRPSFVRISDIGSWPCQNRRPDDSGWEVVHNPQPIGQKVT